MASSMRIWHALLKILHWCASSISSKSNVFREYLIQKIIPMIEIPRLHITHIVIRKDAKLAHRVDTPDWCAEDIHTRRFLVECAMLNLGQDT